MNVLITYTSRMGGTKDLAGAVAAGIGTEAETVVLPIEEVGDLEGYDAVVVGGALYAGRWPRAGRRFVKRNAGALRDRPVWFFSSGPLDDSAHDHQIEPTRSVRKQMGQVDARGHATFGGRLPEDAEGFPASAMAKDNAGDWRHTEDARAWGGRLAAELASAS
jgi:menaquinone-dependent protoporphyrinogen oxidase